MFGGALLAVGILLLGRPASSSGQRLAILPAETHGSLAHHPDRVRALRPDAHRYRVADLAARIHRLQPPAHPGHRRRAHSPLGRSLVRLGIQCLLAVAALAAIFIQGQFAAYQFPPLLACAAYLMANELVRHTPRVDAAANARVTGAHGLAARLSGLPRLPLLFLLGPHHGFRVSVGLLPLARDPCPALRPNHQAPAQFSPFRHHPGGCRSRPGSDRPQRSHRLPPRRPQVVLVLPVPDGLLVAAAISRL